jgi:hypothetical protein
VNGGSQNDTTEWRFCQWFYTLAGKEKKPNAPLLPPKVNLNYQPALRQKPGLMGRQQAVC